jgi:hypothetical protein
MRLGVHELMKSLAKPVTFFLALACLFLSFIETAGAADKTPNQSNFTILGLDIGDCTVQDIYSMLGPTIPIKDGVNQLCYVSDRDETLILFSTKSSKCTGFKMMSQKKRFYKWHFCEKSSLVSKHLTTESGIKLGMSKSSVKTTLGAPRNESGIYLDYVFKWQQKLNQSESETASQISKDRKRNPNRIVEVTIRAEFSDAGLISFDLLKIKQ